MTDYTIPRYELEFAQVVESVAQHVEQWVHSEPDVILDIDQFVDCVYIKMSSRVIAHANAAYQTFFGGDNQVAGSVGDDFLDQATLGVAAKSDELLYMRGNMVEFEYISTGPGGYSYHVKTHKRWISQNRRRLSILGISRIVARVEPPYPPATESLSEIAKKYELLDGDDKSLCCLLAAGHSQREMAQLLGCTTRTIENRRKRIMDVFGVSKPIDIVKLMVRMVEHGLITADF